MLLSLHAPFPSTPSVSAAAVDCCLTFVRCRCRCASHAGWPRLQTRRLVSPSLSQVVLSLPVQWRPLPYSRSLMSTALAHGCPAVVTASEDTRSQPSLLDRVRNAHTNGAQRKRANRVKGRVQQIPIQLRKGLVSRYVPTRSTNELNAFQHPS